MLRIIDMGKCPGLELIACADIPALSPAALTPDDTCTFIYGMATDEHLCIGYNVAWDDYFAGDYSEYTLSRFSAKGGMMYCRGVTMVRVWAPAQLIQPPALEQLLHRAIIQVTQAHVGGAPLGHRENYVYVENKKFAGTSDNWINDRSTCIVGINEEPLDIPAIKKIFRTKSWRKVTDLGEYNIPDDYYRQIAECLARHLGLEARDSEFTAGERDLLAGLRAVHTSDDWLWRAQRDDLQVVPPEGLGFTID